MFHAEREKLSSIEEKENKIKEKFVLFVEDLFREIDN